MAKYKLDPLAEGSKKAKEFQEIMRGAKVTLEEFIAANTKMSQELQSVTQQSSAFFQLAAEGASKAASEMKNVSDSSATTSQNIDSLTGAIIKQGKALEKANKEAGFKKGGDGKNNVFEQLGKSSKVAKAGVIALGGAFNLLGKAIKGAASVIGGIFDVLSTAVGAIKSIIGGVIDLASNAFETMVRMSDEVKNRMFEAAQAIEKVKETFGNLEKGSGKQISGFVKKVMGMYSPGAVRQIFGSITEAADYALGLASSSAEMASLLSDQLEDNATKIAMFAKGLGQTTEDFKAVMDMAYTTGESIDSIQESMLKFSQGIGKSLNLNVKVLSKNLLLAAKDVKHFGKATVQSMAESAAYAMKMGVSLDKIVGVLDKFDTFESAAESVSKLSQAFGVNLDTMKLVEAETPEERMEMLKDSFAAAGKSLDSLSRRELSYAASLIGTDEATVKNMLSNRNQANSLDAIKDASAGVAKQTRSTGDIMEEAMKGIAMSLKQIQRSSSGFFDAFLDGIFEGIFLSGPFQKVLANLAMALDAVFMAGKQLGMIIVSTFPGLKQMLDALAKFFDPKKIGDLFGGFTTSFENFFKNLKNGTGDVKDLFKDLFNGIKSYFLKQGPAGQEFLNGVSEFWGAIKQIIATAILGIGDVVAEGLSFIADFFEGKRKLPNGKDILKSASKELSPIGKAAMTSFEKVGKQFDRIWTPLKESLIKSLKEGVDYLWEYLKQKISENKGKLALAGLFGVAASGDKGILGTAAEGYSAYKTYKQGKQIQQLTQLLKTPPSVPVPSVPVPPVPVPPAPVGAFQALRAGMATPGGFQGLAAGPLGMTLGSVAGGIAASELSRLIAEQAGAGKDGQAVAAALGGAGGGAAIGFMLGGPIGALIGAGSGAIWSLGREIFDAYNEIEEMQQSAAKELENINDNAEQFAIRFGVRPSGSGGMTELSFEGMTDDDLLDQYGALIGGRSWFASDEDDAKRLRAILQEKFEAAKKIQEDNAGKEKKLIEERKKADKELERQAREKVEEDEYNEFMESIGAKSKGPVNILTFKEKIAQIDKTAKDVTKGAAKLKENLDAIRSTLSGINLNLFSDDKNVEENKREQMESTLKTLLRFKGFIITMGEIANASKTSSDSLKGFGSASVAGSTAYNIVEFAKNQKQMLDSIISSFSGGSGNVTKNIEEIKTKTSDLKEIIETSNVVFTSLLGLPELVKKLGNPQLKITDKDTEDAENVIYYLGTSIARLNDTIVRDLSVGQSFDLRPVETAFTEAYDVTKSIKNKFDDFARLQIDTEGPSRVINGLANAVKKMNNATSELFKNIPDLQETGIASRIDKWMNQTKYIFVDSIGGTLTKIKESTTQIESIQTDLDKINKLRETLQNTIQALDTNKLVKIDATSFANNKVNTVLSTPTIQSGNTKIELKFEIRLDAKELEKALVTRNDSIVVEVMRGMAQGTNKQVNVSPGYNVSVGKSSP
jgi:hypothetical protein